MHLYYSSHVGGQKMSDNQHEKSGVAEHLIDLNTHLLTLLSSHLKPYVTDQKASDEHGNNNPLLPLSYLGF